MKNLTAILFSASIVLLTAGARSANSQAPKTPTGPRPAQRQGSTQTPIVSIKQLWQLANALDLKVGIKNQLNGPQFFISAGTLTFYQGSVPTLGDDFVGPRQHPILVPLARTVQLADLRQFLSEQPEVDMKFWDEYFDQATLIIERYILAEIASGNLTGEELYNRVNTYDLKIYNIVESAAKAFSKDRNLKFRQGTIAIPAGHRVEVSFVRNPAEAHLWVIPSTLYAPDGSLDFLWQEIFPDDKPTLGGTYYYKVRWPNGATTEPTLFKVERPGQVFTINQ